MAGSVRTGVVAQIRRLFRAAIGPAKRLWARTWLTAAVQRARGLEGAWKLDEAAQCWQEIMAAWPTKPVGALGYAVVLRRLNRCDEAASVLALARQRFPDELVLVEEQSRVANQQGRHDEALSHASELIGRQVDWAAGYDLAGHALHCLRRFDEAEAVLREGRRHCPANVSIASRFCVVADERGAWPEALARWQALRRDFPNAPVAYAGEGAALKRLKRYADADAVLLAGMQRFPADSNLGVNYGWSADDSGDWEMALQRWSALKERFPGNPRIRAGWIESQGKANLARADLAAEGVAPPEGPGLSDGGTPLGDLFMRFESLGENCELGFAQRQFGAEPTGLLRWAGISFDKLIEGLETKFAGVGTPEQTEMHLNASNHEYYTTDRTFGLSMHTFITKDDVNRDRIYDKLCRRLRYMREKLLDDFAAAEKIFVFQSDRALADDEMRRLHAELRRFGPTVLLVVQPQDGRHQPGSVRVLAEGLVAGVIDRPGYDGRHWAISFDIWRRLCEQTVTLADGWRSAG